MFHAQREHEVTETGNNHSLFTCDSQGFPKLKIAIFFLNLKIRNMTKDFRNQTPVSALPLLR